MSAAWWTALFFHPNNRRILAARDCWHHSLTPISKVIIILHLIHHHFASPQPITVYTKAKIPSVAWRDKELEFSWAKPYTVTASKGELLWKSKDIIKEEEELSKRFITFLSWGWVLACNAFKFKLLYLLTSAGQSVYYIGTQHLLVSFFMYLVKF